MYRMPFVEYPFGSGRQRRDTSTSAGHGQIPLFQGTWLAVPAQEISSERYRGPWHDQYSPSPGTDNPRDNPTSVVSSLTSSSHHSPVDAVAPLVRPEHPTLIRPLTYPWLLPRQPCLSSFPVHVLAGLAVPFALVVALPPALATPFLMTDAIARPQPSL
jgi:hypothetical protein